MGFVIEKITAFVAIDNDGDEGVIGFKMGDQWVPLIAADHIRAAKYFPIALEICEKTGTELKILQFDNRQDVTEQFKK